eukprot:448649_1
MMEQIIEVASLKKIIEQDDILDIMSYESCGHTDGCEIMWELQTRSKDMHQYCDKCATLIRFSEFVKKYVLESEKEEVQNVLWPWYCNYFRRKDVKRYRKYIGKYNLSRLFRINNVLWKDDKKIYNDDESNMNNCGCCKNNGHRNKMFISEYAKSVTPDEEEEKWKYNIRHFRKFAAHVLLNEWNISRNLNIIRMQLAWIIKYGKMIQNSDNNKIFQRDWNDWQIYISQCNQHLKSDPNYSAIRPDINDDTEEKYKSFLVNIFDSITEDKKCTLYKKDYNTLDEREFDIWPQKYYDKFKATWKSVPVWWNDQLKHPNDDTEYSFNYDHLLLDLALQFNLDPRKYKEYFENNNHIDAAGFADFLDWIKDWRNIQHRLRCLVFFICKYLKTCNPNIEDLKIPREYQASKYQCYSIVFLN